MTTFNPRWLDRSATVPFTWEALPATLDTELLAQVDGLRSQLQRVEERNLLDEDFDQLLGGAD